MLLLQPPKDALLSQFWLQANAPRGISNVAEVPSHLEALRLVRLIDRQEPWAGRGVFKAGPL
jgi:hypothetical protein